MFYHIGIVHDQRDLQRFFYRSSVDDILALYRYLVVLFGEKSSPFIANAVCKQHTSRPEMQIKCPAATQVVLNNELYMDDSITGCETTKKAIE